MFGGRSLCGSADIADLFLYLTREFMDDGFSLNIPTLPNIVELGIRVVDI